MKSKYKSALDSLDSRVGISNTGMKNDISNKENTVYLSADFCPSSKHGFEKEFIEKFIKNGHKNISIAITSSWVKKHKKDFQWLIEKHESGMLNITWVNHSKNHTYKHGIVLSQNFLLSPGTNLNYEILDLEKLLIENNQTPSIFARFPGLVSDKKIRKFMIDDFGLIFLGSDAWLAKGQIPKNGSIILIHGNKNEPLGIQKAYKYLDTISSAIKFGNISDAI